MVPPPRILLILPSCLTLMLNCSSQQTNTAPRGITSLQEEATAGAVALKAWAHPQFVVNYSGFCLLPPQFPKQTSPLLGIIYLAPASAVRSGSFILERGSQRVSQDFGALRPGPSNSQHTPTSSGTLQTVI